MQRKTDVITKDFLLERVDKSNVEIADEVGCSPSLITSKKKKFGVYKEPQSVAADILTEDYLKDKLNLNNVEISKITGIPPTTISHYRVKFELQFKQQVRYSKKLDEVAYVKNKENYDHLKVAEKKIKKDKKIYTQEYSSYKEVTKEKILEWQEEGLTDTEMGQKCGCLKASFRRYRQSLGVEFSLVNRDFAKKEIPFDRDYLEDLYFNKMLSFPKMGELLGHSASTIHSWFKKLGIETFKNRKERSNINGLELTEEQKNIIFGGLLGDSWAEERSGEVARIHMSHSIKQKDYLEYKANKIEEFITERGISSRERYKSFLKSIKITKSSTCSTKTLELFYPIYKKFYRDSFEKIEGEYGGKKIIPYDIEEWLNLQSLAIWFGDDGSADHSGKLIIWFGDFDPESCKRGLEAVRKMGYEVTMHYNYFKLPGMIFSDESSIKFRDEIKRYLPESMHYKFKYTDNPYKNDRNKRIAKYLVDYPQITPEVLVKYYIEDGLSDGKISKIFNVNRFIINYLRNFYGISRKAGILVKGDIWKSLSDSAKLKSSQHIVKYLRGTPPFEVPSDERVLYLWGKLKEYSSESDSLVGSSYYNTMCFAFHPYIFSQKTTTKICNSPEDFFLDDGLFSDEITSYLNKKDEIKDSDVRKMLKQSPNIRAVSYFRPTTAKNIYKKYCCENDYVLDPCAGYGGRLLGAASLGLSYVGIDPSNLIEAGNKRMIKELGVNNVSMILGCAEDVMMSFPSNSFDFIFTSPPYFDLELYDESNEQSYKRYNSWDKWIEGFYFPLFRESFRLLKKDKFFVLNISKEMIDDTEKISKKIGFLMQEVINISTKNVYGKERLNPLYVFRKTN